jgi:hypothetical protein
MDPAFSSALSESTEHSAFGLRLYPLTLGHLFLLSELDATFLVEEVEPSMDDLLIATFIAAHRTARQARKSLASRWAKVAFWLWGRASRRRILRDEIEKLRVYVKSQQSAPVVELPIGNVQTRELRAPEHWRLLAMLMSDFHCTREQAMDTTMNFARALWAVQGERMDKLTLAWGSRTSAAIAELREKLAKENVKA